MKKFSVATIPAAAVALGLTMGSGAFAGGHAQCEAYANEAVSLARKISDGGCDTFRGGRFSFNSQEHYVWCMRAGDGDIDAERRTRYDAENSCRTCGSYASEAVQTNSQNLRLKCGGTGVQWHSDHRAHLFWCLGAHPGIIQSETMTRANAIAGCQRK